MDSTTGPIINTRMLYHFPKFPIFFVKKKIKFMTTNEEPEPASAGQEHFYWGKYIATEFINWTINLMGSFHNKLCIKWASCPKRQYCTLSQLGQRFDLLPLFSAMEASLCSRRAQPCFTNKSSTFLSSPSISWYSCIMTSGFIQTIWKLLVWEPTCTNILVDLVNSTTGHFISALKLVVPMRLLKYFVASNDQVPPRGSTTASWQWTAW